MDSRDRPSKMECIKNGHEAGNEGEQKEILRTCAPQNASWDGCFFLKGKRKANDIAVLSKQRRPRGDLTKREVVRHKARSRYEGDKGEDRTDNGTMHSSASTAATVLGREGCDDSGRSIRLDNHRMSSSDRRSLDPYVARNLFIRANG
jgi:hypothetical protein